MRAEPGTPGRAGGRGAAGRVRGVHGARGAHGGARGAVLRDPVRAGGRLGPALLRVCAPGSWPPLPRWASGGRPGAASLCPLCPAASGCQRRRRALGAQRLQPGWLPVLEPAGTAAGTVRRGAARCRHGAQGSAGRAGISPSRPAGRAEPRPHPTSAQSESAFSPKRLKVCRTRRAGGGGRGPRARARRAATARGQKVRHRYNPKVELKQENAPRVIQKCPESSPEASTCFITL